MLVFLDTEFTRFNHPGLISIALVAEDGREFYAERSDFRYDDCSEFVIETVLPLLGRVPGAACSRSEITSRLHEWFAQLPGPATLVFDFETDWLLLVDAILGSEYKTPPANFGERIELLVSTIVHPVFEEARDLLYSDEWPEHHALADARALKAGYCVWLEYKNSDASTNE